MNELAQTVQIITAKTQVAPDVTLPVILIAVLVVIAIGLIAATKRSL